MKPFRWFGVVLVVVLAALGLPACGGGGKEAATTTSSSVTSSTAPSTTTSTTAASSTTTAPSTTAPPTTAKPALTELSLYFVHGDHLATARRKLAAGSMPATAAVRALLSGPTAAEKASGLSTAIPAGVTLRSITIRDGRAFVDVSKSFESGGGTLSMQLRLAQLVFTVTQFSTVDYVITELDGAQVSVFSSEGLLLDSYQRRTDFESVLPAVLVESPGWGAVVDSPVRIRGSANTFEAVLRVEITDWDGRIVASKVVMATSGTGTRGTFDVTLSYTTNRTGPGELITSYDSAKDGSRVVVEEIPLTVSN